MKPRPKQLLGKTHKIKINDDLKFYITVNYLEDKPYEIFVNCKNVDAIEHLTAVTLMISRMLQSQIDPGIIAADLKSIHSAKTGHFHGKAGWIPSLYARVGELLV